ncbi:hypothetical protein SNE40_007260 [Patella caerulea]|uniref:Carbohydrate sulfotransferase n=2 Tax=Patella caerulea TaxID=87958 RepID=A0AAN8Q817_PATCE
MLIFKEEIRILSKEVRYVGVTESERRTISSPLTLLRESFSKPSKNSPHIYHASKKRKRKLPSFTIKESPGPLTYLNMTPIAQEQERRAELLKNSCQGNEDRYQGLSSTKWAFERIEMDTNSHLVYCPLLKVGSTFWRRIFYALRTKTTIHTPYDISIKTALAPNRNRKTLKDLQVSNDSWRYLEEASRIMYIREPYARLLSGYTDKLFAPNPYFWGIIGRYIIRNFRVNATETSKRCGHDVTFSEFVKYVIYTEEYNKTERDAHFTPAYDQCKPCQVQFNIIGKMETFIQDTSYVMNKIGFNVSKELLKEWANKAEEDAIFDSTASPFSWKKGISKCMSMYQAGKRIWRKMQIRGVVDKKISLPFGTHKMNSVSSTHFIKALIMSRKKSEHNRKRQKREALIDAFSQVSLEDKLKLKELYYPDFELFGYDPEPKDLFETPDRRTFRTKYFNLNGV